MMRVSKQWLSKWLTRRQTSPDDPDWYRDRSSRPKTIRTRRHRHTEAILEAKQRWPHMGAQKLKVKLRIDLSHDRIHLVLQENKSCRRQKKPWRKIKRFERPYANYLWQLDTKQSRAENGDDVFILSIIDDHSRCILASQILLKDPTQADSIRIVRKAIQMWGKPRQVLTDNGKEFTHAGSAMLHWFTRALAAWGIKHIRGRSRHPQTQGKIERWHGSLEHEWFAFHDRPATAPGFTALMDRWHEHYGLERPHRALGMRTPLEVYLGSLFLTEPLARAVNEVP
jgi:transposase InsO family protein